MERLVLLEGHIISSNNLAAAAVSKGPKLLPPVDDVWASIKGDEYLTEKGIAMRKKARVMMEAVEPTLIPYLNTCEFPFEVIPQLAALGINGFHIKDHGGPGLSSMDIAATIMEIGKVDGSILNFLIVHNSIGMATVDLLGNEEQRKRILPDCIALKKVMSFGLTEAEYGSDATSLKTTAKKVEGGYSITGNKRWIGNATFADYIIIWARNENEGGKIQGFVVEKGSKGLQTKKIENKYSLRMAPNADIILDNVFVPDNNRLAKALDFATGANVILEHSRIKVAWGAVSIAAGAYEAALRYSMSRKQFGYPIAKFQASQIKLSYMLAAVEGMIAQLIRITQLQDQGKTSIGQIGRAKSYCTKVGREVCQMARDLCGGNGILIENRVIKQFMDMEALHTFEGTFEINMLVSGREITGGLNAFK